MDQAADLRLSTLLEELAELADADIETPAYYAETLGRVASVTGAVFSSAWDYADGSFYLLHATGSEAPVQPRSYLWASVLESNEARIVLPGAADSQGRVVNETGNTLFVCAVSGKDRPYSILELAVPAGTSTAKQQECLQLCEVAARLATTHHERTELTQLRDDYHWWADLHRYANAIHRTLHLRKTAWTIVNDGRTVAGCDRLWLLLKRGNRYRAMTVSGQDSVNRRSNLVKKLEQLARTSLATGESLVYPSDTVLPPQIENLLHEYLDESKASTLALTPMFEPEANGNEPTQSHSARPLTGALVAEKFSGELDARQFDAVCQQAASALGNALEHSRVFLLPLWSAIGKWRVVMSVRTFPKILLALAIIAAVVAAAIWVPADFEIYAEGALQPERRTPVFAPVDGVVEELYVRHRSPVKVDTPLLLLRSSELELELEEVSGEHRTTARKLASLNASRIAAATRPGINRAEINAMAAEEVELKTWLQSLEKQMQILSQRKKELTVASKQDGAVITWDLQQLLTARPVSRGQILMTTAQLDGQWVLELNLPDNKVGHLRDAQAALREDLDVSFILATTPETTLKGKIQSVAESTTYNDRDGLTLLVTVAIDESQVKQLRPGARVSGKIYCGKRSLGYVWLHEVFEFVQSKILFRFF